MKKSKKISKEYQKLNLSYINIIDKEWITSQKKMTEENLTKVIKQLLVIFCILKMRKYVLPMFQSITQIMKSKFIFYLFQTKKNDIILQSKIIMSQQHGNLYWLNSLHSFAAINKLESPKNVWKNKKKLKIFMTSADNKIF